MRGSRHRGPGAAERDVERSEISGNRASAGCGDDGGLGLVKKPLDCLAVGLVAELAGELEDARGARSWHADSSAAAVDLGVPVFGGASLWRGLLLLVDLGGPVSRYRDLG